MIVSEPRLRRNSKSRRFVRDRLRFERLEDRRVPASFIDLADSPGPVNLISDAGAVVAVVINVVDDIEGLLGGGSTKTPPVQVALSDNNPPSAPADDSSTDGSQEDPPLMLKANLQQIVGQPTPISPAVQAEIDEQAKTFDKDFGQETVKQGLDQITNVVAKDLQRVGQIAPTGGGTVAGRNNALSSLQSVLNNLTSTNLLGADVAATAEKNIDQAIHAVEWANHKVDLSNYFGNLRDEAAAAADTYARQAREMGHPHHGRGEAFQKWREEMSDAYRQAEARFGQEATVAEQKAAEYAEIATNALTAAKSEIQGALEASVELLHGAGEALNVGGFVVLADKTISEYNADLKAIQGATTRDEYINAVDKFYRDGTVNTAEMLAYAAATGVEFEDLPAALILGPFVNTAITDGSRLGAAFVYAKVISPQVRTLAGQAYDRMAPGATPTLPDPFGTIYLQ